MIDGEGILKRGMSMVGKIKQQKTDPSVCPECGTRLDFIPRGLYYEYLCPKCGYSRTIKRQYPPRGRGFSQSEIDRGEF